MSDKPTGIFVRLPLSDEQIRKLYNPKKSGNENLLAIGTPVTGDEVDRLITHKQALAKLAEKDAEIARKDREISRLMSALSEIHKMKVAVGFKDNNISLDMRYLALETLQGSEA